MDVFWSNRHRMDSASFHLPDSDIEATKMHALCQPMLDMCGVETDPRNSDCHRNEVEREASAKVKKKVSIT